jgi:hypothetical protein
MPNPDPQTFLTVRLYTNENRRRTPGWSFDDLALLKSIKATSTRLWHTHRLENKVIRLQDWKG